MAPKQLSSDAYLSTEDGMSTPPKERFPPEKQASSSPRASPVLSTPPPRVLSRRRSTDGAVSRKLQGKGGFLFQAEGGSPEESPDENDDWEQNSLSSTGNRSSPDPASRSPRTVRGVAPIHRTMSSPSFPRSPSGRTSKAALPAFKVFVLLLRPRDKIFELIQVEYDPSRATVGDVLDLVPASATEPKLGNQRHVGLMRTADGTELTDLALPASPNVFSADGATANVARGDILVAIPEGYTGEKCRQLSDKILRNPKMVRLLRRKDPLKPKKRRSTKSEGGSVSSMSSGGSGLTSASGTSSVGSFKRRGSRRVACVPPTVMEEGPEHAESNPAKDKPSPTRIGGSSNASVSMHSLDTASVRNTAASKLGALPRELDAIAELLSKDNEHEKRRREEEERARAAVEERRRKEQEARDKAEAEERIRGEIEKKAREKAEEEKRKREEAKQQREREQEERNRKTSEEERRMEELARKADQAERAWERVCADDTPPSPPASPRSPATRRSFAMAAAQHAIPSPYPEEIEVPSSEASSSSSSGNGSGGNKGGLEMFVFGMISSAVMVALAARAINAGHPQVPVVVVEEAAAASTQAHVLHEHAHQQQHRLAQAVQDQPSASTQDGTDLSRRIAYSFAIFVFLQVIVLILVRSRRARRVSRKISRRLKSLAVRAGLLNGVGAEAQLQSHASSVSKMRRNRSAQSLVAMGKSHPRSRSTLVAATQAAARRSDYGYGSGGGANWRKAANL